MRNERLRASMRESGDGVLRILWSREQGINGGRRVTRSAFCGRTRSAAVRSNAAIPSR
jgi:hypothetical protein